jgi:hypothetical protein
MKRLDRYSAKGSEESCGHLLNLGQLAGYTSKLPSKPLSTTSGVAGSLHTGEVSNAYNEVNP